MEIRKNANSYRHEVEARLKILAGLGPMIDGSLVVFRRRCGNPNCHCAKGEKHPGNYLTRKVKGKTQALYIPADMVEEVRQWNKEHRRLKKLVAEICERQRKLVKLTSEEKRRKKS